MVRFERRRMSYIEKDTANAISCEWSCLAHILFFSLILQQASSQNSPRQMIATTTTMTTHRPTTLRSTLRSHTSTRFSARSRGDLPNQMQKFRSLEPIPEDSSKDFAPEELSPTSILIADTLLGAADSLRSSHQLELVNQDRRSIGLNPFRSSKSLDYLASLHVIAMTAKKSVFHSVSCVAELIQRLSSDRVAENIQRGDDIVVMHEKTMQQECINRSNILSTKFSEFGSAVASGEDGKLYTCQLFRGKSSS